MIIKIPTGLDKRGENLSETFNKERENTKRNGSEMKNSVTEIKHTLEGINSRLEDSEGASNLEVRVVESNQAEQ